jgi:hypothetical protein
MGFVFRKKPTIASGSGRLCYEGKLFEKLQSKPIGHFKRQGVVMKKVRASHRLGIVMKKPSPSGHSRRQVVVMKKPSPSGHSRRQSSNQNFLISTHHSLRRYPNLWVWSSPMALMKPEVAKVICKREVTF